MTFPVSVLSLGIVVLVCGSLALLVVRLSSPGLRGTGWLSGAFAAGAVGAGLIVRQGSAIFACFGADLALLLSFALLHTAVLRLIRDKSGNAVLPGILIACQLVSNLLCLDGLAAPKLRVISMGIAIGIQTAATSTVLWRHARHRVRIPAIFSATILVLFTAFNFFRSAVEALTYRDAVHPGLRMAAFLLYLGTALGVAFGFLWMTTARLTGELEQMASTDPLTRLFNRRIFLKWCDRELLRSARTCVPFSLLIVDLDHFKRVNDDYGHHTGDHVLCAAVEQMQDSVRGIDVLCRWGGEEFAVLLPNANVAATRVVAERIRENIGKVVLPLRSSEPDDLESFSLTASIGTATCRGSGDTIFAMLERADQALYGAKRSGRNRVLEAA